MLSEQEAFDLVIRCLKEVAAVGQDRLDEITMDTDLKAESLIDSLDALSVVFEIEKESGVRLPDRDVAEQGLLTMRGLVTFLVQKSAASSEESGGDA